MKLGKRQLVIGALVIALGAAMYLNYQFADGSNLLAANTNVSSTSKEIGKAQFVNNSTDSSAGSSANNDSDSSTQTNLSPEEYFAQVRVEREKANDEVKDLAEDILKSAESSDSAKVEAVAKGAELANIIQQQTNLEGLIKAKGFSDVLVFIQNGDCRVVVTGGSLSEENVIAIKDLVNGQANISFDKIKITEV